MVPTPQGLFAGPTRLRTASAMKCVLSNPESGYIAGHRIWLGLGTQGGCPNSTSFGTLLEESLRWVVTAAMSKLDHDHHRPTNEVVRRLTDTPQLETDGRPESVGRWRLQEACPNLRARWHNVTQTYGENLWSTASLSCRGCDSKC